MKKIVALILAAALLLTCCAALAEDKPLAGKHLKIGMSPDFMYFETVSETDPCGYEGLDIDIIKKLSDSLGFTWEIVPMPFASLIGALQSQQVDFVISGMSESEERWKAVDFSIVYAKTSIGAVARVDSPINSLQDLEGKVVCCSQGSTNEAIIESIPGATLKTFQGQSAIGLAVANGQDGVEAGLTSINGSKKLANTVLDADGKPMLKYIVLESDAIADIYNIAFPKGSELKDLFNAELQKMIDSGELDTMIKGWLY